MSFKLPNLPYAKNALEPFISSETLEYHHGKHHQAYVNKLNELIPGTPFEQMSLEDIICKSDGAIFNNAAQIWNHTFYWYSMKPKGGGEPEGSLAAEINEVFGSFEDFKQQFTTSALTQFGSGWAWLVKNKLGNLEVMHTSNAGSPLTEGKEPLLTCDVWEHAYYIDTRNDRAKYLGNFWQLVNWEFVTKNFNGAGVKHADFV